MKRLTTLTIFLSIPVLIASIYGMNVPRALPAFALRLLDPLAVCLFILAFSLFNYFKRIKIAMFNIRVYGILINEKKKYWSVMNLSGRTIYKILRRWPGIWRRDTRLSQTRVHGRNAITSSGWPPYLYHGFLPTQRIQPQQQIISIYYHVHPLEPISVPLRNEPFAFDENQLAQYAQTGETETFRLVAWEDFSADTVTLPIDKIVAEMIRRT